MSRRLQTAGADAWLSNGVQEDVLEHRVALLARRHLDDVAHEKDTSYDVFVLTMAHADLIYWRALQAQIGQSPDKDRHPLQTLANVVSARPGCLSRFGSESVIVRSYHHGRRLSRFRGRRLSISR